MPSQLCRYSSEALICWLHFARIYRVSISDATCWTVIRRAAAGNDGDRSLFVRRYTPVIRAYLDARWRGRPLLSEVDDAIQEVFWDCFRENGALARADPDRPRGFRPFLHGVVRNIALRVERKHARTRERQAPTGFDPDRIASDEESLSRIFDRAWARAIMREAADEQARMARQEGAEAERRVDLVRLRFHEGMPIREIATLWQIEATKLHREYAKARREFRAALYEVVAFHHPGTPTEIERECIELLNLVR